MIRKSEAGPDLADPQSQQSVCPARTEPQLPPQVAAILSLQCSAGNRAVNHLAQRAHAGSGATSTHVQMQLKDQASPHFQHVYRKSPLVSATGIGHFDAVEYNSEDQRLTITVRPNFQFPPFNLNAYPYELRNEPEFAQRAKTQHEQQKEAFKFSFVRQTEAWGGKHTFYCHEQPLRGRRADVRVQVDLLPAGDNESQTYVTIVDQNPLSGGSEARTGARTGSIVVQWSAGYNLRYDPNGNVMVPEGVGPPLDLIGEAGGPHAKMPESQLTLMHEMGHVFGLGDEYVDAKKPEYARGSPTEHSKLAKEMLNKDVAHGGDDESIMAAGNKILPQHGVTFLDALRKVTGLRWEFDPVT
jgi:hypothetical protein